MSELNKIQGNIMFKHPTKDFTVTPSFTEEAIILTIEYSDGTIATRYVYSDKRPSEIYVNKPVKVDMATGIVTILEQQRPWEL